MAREFTIEDAKTVINKHNKILNNLKIGAEYSNSYKNSINNTITVIINKKIVENLRSISVDELNKDKVGIRVSALKNAGYNTIASLVSLSARMISNIRGIGDQTAYMIRERVNAFAENEKKSIKIKLSVDNKQEDYTKLVDSIYKYKESKQYSNNCSSIYNYYFLQVQDNLNDIKPALNGFKWFFTSKKKKENATAAYDNLNALLKGDYLRKTNEVILKLNEISSVNTSVCWADFSANPISYNKIIEEIAPEVMGSNDQYYGLPEGLAQEIEDECFFPDGLLCELRKYQEIGVKYILHQGKVLLGDEMGLGKTVQAIATMVSLKNTGAKHFCVVCPASVVSNWCREITKHSKLRALRVHGKGAKSVLNEWIKNGGVAVTTYEYTRKIEFDPSFKFSLLVVDEAHYIKNEGANRTKNTIDLSKHASRLLFMTGTALENKVDEMIKLINDLRPDIAYQIRNKTYLAAAPQFRQDIAPVYYRRKREEVLSELPEKNEIQEWCSMTPQETEVYENAVLNSKYNDARRVSWSVDDLSYSSKASRLLEILDEVAQENRKTIVFSFYLDTIYKIYELLGSKCMIPITGSISAQKRQEIIDEFSESDEPKVLLAQITSGGTGLNIQAASVVIICEPQLKPSIENQAISRCYRMGQSRNVFVHRLLCENSIDEKIIDALEAKQTIFDAFADKSVAAASDKEKIVDDKKLGEIIKEEIDRINKKRSNGEQEFEHQNDEDDDATRETFIKPMSVTNRIKVCPQPYGGYINPSTMNIASFAGNEIDTEGLNCSPGLVGMCVDYMTRFLNGTTLPDAFKISLNGANVVGKTEIAYSMLKNINGINDESVRNAYKLVQFDVYARNISYLLANGYHEPSDINLKTIDYIKELMQRTHWFFTEKEKIVLNGIYYNGDAFGKYIVSGDGDYLSTDTIWDLKSSKNPPSKDDTLQVLIYYLLGRHAHMPQFDSVTKIGIFNPILNKAYTYDINKIDSKVIEEIEKNVIGY